MATRLQHLLPALNRLADCSTPVDLDQVGLDACLSPHRAQRVFTAIVGESPKQFQLRVRLQRATALLLGSDARIVDIAVASGFGSHEAFTRAFGRFYGRSPSRYRKTVGRWPSPLPVQLASHTAPCIGVYRCSLSRKPDPQNHPQEQQPTMGSTSYEIERHTVEAVPVLYGTRRLDRDKIADGLAEVLPAAFGYAMSAGLAMSGPPFVRYVDQSPAFITVEAGVQLAETAAAPPTDTGLSVGHLPAGSVAVTTHRGPYESLGDAHIALDRWMIENELAPTGPPWEIYTTDPGEVPDPADWLTEVVWPIG
ncbi:MAG: helix-turn-helix domain-containing protein [Acidimicrobiales bacterium]